MQVFQLRAAVLLSISRSLFTVNAGGSRHVEPPQTEQVDTGTSKHVTNPTLY
jgi:hypothetical protein